jgi:hypothetical protein
MLYLDIAVLSPVRSNYYLANRIKKSRMGWRLSVIDRIQALNSAPYTIDGLLPSTYKWTIISLAREKHDPDDSARTPGDEGTVQSL